MDNAWIQVAFLGNEWKSKTVYINPIMKTAKVFKSEISHWGYHDESEWDESEEIISVEQALAMVYPDKEAIALIKAHMGNDYADVLADLARKGNA